MTIVGEPTKFSICTKSKGCWEYQIDITGKSCHSSNPSNGVNACYILAKLINKIEELCNKFQNTTLNCGVVKGGEKVNIVADTASIIFDIRSDKSIFANKALEEIKEFIVLLENLYPESKISIKNTLSIPALEKRANLITNDIINKFSLTESEFVGGCEAGYFQALGGEAFLLGVGDLALAHKPNEYLSVEDYFKYNKLLLEILRTISAIKKTGQTF